MKISVSIKALLSWLQILTSLLSQLPLSLSSSINLPLTGGLVGSCGHPLSLSLCMVGGAIYSCLLRHQSPILPLDSIF